MKNILVLVAGVSLVAGISTGQQPEDPHGWNKAKWGISESAVQALFPGALRTPDGALKVGGIEIEKLECSISFAFNEDRLVGVLISPEAIVGLGKGPTGALANVAHLVFLPGLKDKYGEPKIVDVPDDLGGVSHSWEWMFAETVISLTYYQNSRDPRLDVTYLAYRKRQRSSVL